MAEAPRATYRVQILPAALHALERIPEPYLAQIRHKIDALAHNPRPQGAKRLKGSEFMRERSGDYRIIYSIDQRVLTVLVIKIGKRGDVYRGM
ncbi:MAG: type II toxin-antitoxin system RelE/ParE family toxin [Planctomycetes bacterium]|nr:type II toxin-antitoxin system RelE/ParE family toxin [Planctomycetota bacterium]